MLDERILAGTEARGLPGYPNLRPFTALLRDDDGQRDAALSRLLSELARPEVRVVRMGNSTRSRLMLEHIMVQVAGSDGRVSQEDAARRIARTIAERQGRETRVVLLVTQAETLHSKTLRLLQAMQPFFAESGEPTLQVVFVGRQAFRALLDEHGLTSLRDALGFQPQAEDARPTPDDMPAPATEAAQLSTAYGLGQPPAPADPAATPASPDAERDHPGPVSIRPFRPDAAERAAMSVPAARPRRNLALGLAVFAAMALAAYVGLHAALDRPVQARAVPSVLRPAAPPGAVPSPALQVPQASTPPVPARSAPALPSPALPGSALPTQAVPSDPGRSTLPAAPPSRIVIHVPAGSEGAEAMSARLRAELGAQGGAVEARRVADAPGRPSIRYFHPGDEPAARQAAAWMADAGLAWTLQDFSAFSPRPSRGTIEVWLPRS